MGLGDKIKDGLGYVGDAIGGVVGGIIDPVLGTSDKKKAAEEQLQFQKDALAQSQANIDAARQNIEYDVNRGTGYLNQGYNQATGALAEGYNQSRSDMSPLLGLQGYEGGATSAVRSGIGDYSGVSGQRLGLEGRMAQGDQLYQQAGQAAQMENDPGYQFRLQQGEEAINRSAAARGGRLGGATLKALAGYNSGMAAQEYGAANDRQMARNAQQAGILGQQYGAAGNTDQMRQNAMMAGANATQQQAQNNFQGQLAAQQNQYGLTQTGYGAQGEYAQMANQYGANQANMATQRGQNLAQLMQAQAGMETGLATGSNQAAQNYAGYGGITSQAAANAKGDNAGLIAAIASAFCDRNLKTNIDNGSAAADELLKALKPHTFEYINKAMGEGTLLGIMAQDLEESSAGAQIVIETPRGKMIDSSKAVMALLGLVARLSARIDALENRHG